MIASGRISMRPPVLKMVKIVIVKNGIYVHVIGNIQFLKARIFNENISSV